MVASAYTARHRKNDGEGANANGCGIYGISEDKKDGSRKAGSPS